jgi:hypothetical protein
VSGQRAVVFVGPSLSLDDARALLAADYRPPAAQGDVLAAVEEGAAAIAVIDGYFEHVPSVWHKEILFALSRGVHVFGGASMGALRAAELDAFGMVGVGGVYELFRQGTLTDDEEVAVVHGPAEQQYRPCSQALVDLRDRLGFAQATGAIGAHTAAQLVELARARFYAERSVRQLVVDGLTHGVDGAELERFQAAVAEQGPGLKQRDATEVLRRVSAQMAGPPAPFVPAFVFERTVFFERMVSSVQQRRQGPLAAGDLAHAVASVLAKAEIEPLGRGPTAAHTKANVHNLRRRLGLLEMDATLAWLKEHDLSISDLVDEANDEAFIHAAARLHLGSVTSVSERRRRLAAASEKP